MASKDRAAKAAKPKGGNPIWLDEPEAHDFPAAASYLSLLASEHAVEGIVRTLQQATTQHFAAKDILRASRLPLLPLDNPHVASDLAKVKGGKRLSPVLLVRGDVASGRDLQVVDGYHRVCASYHLDENTPIPARIVSL